MDTISELSGKAALRSAKKALWSSYEWYEFHHEMSGRLELSRSGDCQ